MFSSRFSLPHTHSAEGNGSFVLLCFANETIAEVACKPLSFPATVLLNPDLIDEIPLKESSLKNTRRKENWEGVRLSVCSYNKRRGQKPGWRKSTKSQTSFSSVKIQQGVRGALCRTLREAGP